VGSSRDNNKGGSITAFDVNNGMRAAGHFTNTRIDYQGRLDFDRDLGGGFLPALGTQELYSQWFRGGSILFCMKNG
jgi:hypothetical protein